MLRKKKKKHVLPEGDVNIVSLMDILTTLLFFILMVTSLSKFTVLESTSLVSGDSSADPNKKVFTLQVSLKKKTRAQVWLGPTQGLKIVKEDELNRYLGRFYKGSSQKGFVRNFKGKDLNDLLARIQSSLIVIKRAFPHETQAVVSFNDGLSYQNMIDSLSAVRTLGPEDRPFVLVNLINQKEKTKVLFPQVIIAEEGDV